MRQGTLAYSEREGMLYIRDGYNNKIVKVNREGQVVGTLIKNWRVQKFAAKK